MPTSYTKWCTNCQSYQKAYDGDTSRCWNCDKWSLTSSAVVPTTGSVSNTGTLAVANSASSTVRSFVSEANQSGANSGECLIVQGNMYDNSWNMEKLSFNRSSGNYRYEKSNSSGR